MKTIFLSFLILLSSAVSAQIFITSAHFIDVSDVVQIGRDTNPSISHTPPGPNQTWDYAELNDYEIDYVALGMAEWFSQASNFPNATLGSEDENGTQVFFRKDTEAFDLVGIYGDIFESGQPISMAFTPYQRQLTFPSTYGTTFENLSTINIFLEDFEGADSVVVTVETHRFSEMDAWGSITTPYGTFDAIRQHIKDSVVQTATAYLFGLPVFNETESAITHSYAFFSDAQNARYMLLQYNYDPEANLLENVEWQMAAPVLNTPDHADASLNAKIYPNPASEDINIIFDETFTGEIAISDLSGKVVYQTTIENASDFNLLINNWSPGLYIAQLNALNKSTVIRFVIQ